MSLTGLLRLEGVEDPVCRVPDLERVPRDRAFLACGDLAAAAQEVGQIVAFSRLCLEESKIPSWTAMTDLLCVIDAPDMSG